MSTATKTAAPAVSAPPKKGGKLPLVIGAAVVLLGGGAAAFWFLRPHKPTSEVSASEAAATARSAPLYYKFDPAFVVNFGAEGNVRFLQITLEAMSRDPAVVEAIKSNEPAIRNDLVLLFSAQQYDSLMAPEGKEKLREATLESVRKAINAEGGKGAAIEGVYFTSFVIQ